MNSFVDKKMYLLFCIKRLTLTIGLFFLLCFLTSCTVFSVQIGEETEIITAQISREESAFASSTWSNPDVRVVEVFVSKVSDGDTIRATVDGKNQRVRLIGVDCPEIAHPEDGIKEEFFGAEAFTYTKKTLEGKKVYLSFDEEERDQYDRLLAYLWLKNPRGFEEDFEYAKEFQFNCMLIENGYAKSIKVPPNLTFYSLHRALSREAKESKRGLWSK